MGGMATEPSSLSKPKGADTAPSGQAGPAARASDTGAPRSFITQAFPQAQAMGPGAAFAAGQVSPSLGGKREPERAGFAAKPVRGNRKRVRKLSEPNPYSYTKTMEDRSRGESLLELGRAGDFGQDGKAGQPSTPGNDTNAQILEIIRRRQAEAKAQAKAVPPTTLLKQPDLPELRTPDGNAPRNLLESAQALAARRKARDTANAAAQPAGLQPAVFRPGQQQQPAGLGQGVTGGIVKAQAPSGVAKDRGTSWENVKNVVTTWASDTWDATKETALDALEGAVRSGADAGKAVGWDMAGESLQHFLDGKGADVRIPRDEARKRGFIREAEETNRNRFADHLLKDRVGQNGVSYPYLSQISGLKDGQSTTIAPTQLGGGTPEPEPWDVRRSSTEQFFGRGPDEALAYGSSQFNSVAEKGLKATRNGDTITVTGIVTHRWEDRYDFHGSDDYYGLMNTLRDAGRAAEFNSSTSWQQEMTATIRIENGKMRLDSVDWRDLPEGKQP